MKLTAGMHAARMRCDNVGRSCFRAEGAMEIDSDVHRTLLARINPIEGGDRGGGPRQLRHASRRRRRRRSTNSTFRGRSTFLRTDRAMTDRPIVLPVLAVRSSSLLSPNVYRTLRVAFRAPLHGYSAAAAAALPQLQLLQRAEYPPESDRPPVPSVSLSRCFRRPNTPDGVRLSLSIFQPKQRNNAGETARKKIRRDS